MNANNVYTKTYNSLMGYSLTDLRTIAEYDYNIDIHTSDTKADIANACAVIEVNNCVH